MDDKNLDNQIQMPEHIKKMFEKRRQQSSEVKNSASVSVQNDDLQTLHDETAQSEPLTNSDGKKSKIKKPKKVKEKKSEKKSKKESKQQETFDDNGNKKHKFGKKFWIIITICILCIIGLVIGLVFGLSPQYTKIQAPPNITVHSLSDRTIVSVKENNKAIKYEFKISNDEKSDIIKSDSPSFTFTSYLKNVGEYQIQARYIGKNERENSEYSAVYTYVYRDVLDTPVVNMQSNSLFWQRIANASAYYVYYGTDGSVPLYFTVEQAAETSQTISFDLSALKINPAGKYYLYVQAISQAGSFYTNSNLSAPVEYDIVKQLLSPSDVSYSRSSNVLSFNIDSDEQKDLMITFEITINQTYKYTYKTNFAGTINIDLSPHILAKDITSLSIRALGDDVYLLSSSEVNVKFE